jgi:hypothetical protein
MNQRYAFTPVEIGGKPETPIFIRPDSGLKNFVGAVMDHDAVMDLSTSCAHYDPTDLVITAIPKPIAAEWRLLFRVSLPPIGSNYKVHYITGSQYQLGGEHLESPIVPEDLIGFTTEMLERNQWFPDPLFWVDMAESNGKYRFNEFSAFLCAGLYASDIGKIVEEINSITWI